MGRKAGEGRENVTERKERTKIKEAGFSKE